jgi:membrane protein DedA with SNARE-associated domain
LSPAPTLLDLIAVHGPWIVFFLAILETSFITGLIMPSGVATSIATGIALEEGGSVLPVALAALAGGAIGDSVGFWIGRTQRERWLSGDGPFARRVRDVQARSEEHLSGRPFLSVTVARVISFVRTVMPMAAGMSGLSYVRYLPYELLGLLVWCALYVAMGAGLGETWVLAIRLFDSWAWLLGSGVVVVAWLVLRRRGRDRAHNRRA